MTEPTLSDVVTRLDERDIRFGALERRVNSIDQRLERVETRLEAFQSGTNTFHTAILAEMSLMGQRADNLEKIVVEIRDSLNGSRPS